MTRKRPFVCQTFTFTRKTVYGRVKSFVTTTANRVGDRQWEGAYFKDPARALEFVKYANERDTHSDGGHHVREKI